MSTLVIEMGKPAPLPLPSGKCCVSLVMVADGDFFFNSPACEEVVGTGREAIDFADGPEFGS